MRLLLCGLGLVLLFTACEKTPEETTEESPSTEALVISESTNQSVVLGNTTLTYSATDGTSPYVFSVSAGGSTIDSSTGAYTASTSPADDAITVTDSAGNTASMKIKSLGSPGLWLRADKGVTSTAGKVSLWADQSGHGNDFTQSNATMQPTLTTFNSFDAISFNGTTNGLANTTQSGMDLSGDSSVFFVIQSSGCDPSSSNVQNTILSQNAGSPTKGTYFSSAFCTNAGNPAGTLGIARPWGTDGTISSSVGYGAGTPLARGTTVSTIVSGTTSSYFVDGTSVGSGGDIGTGGSSAVTSIGFIVNNGGPNTNGGNNDYYLKGNIMEVMIFPSALTSNRQVIECYLSAKYNLGLSSCL